MWNHQRQQPGAGEQGDVHVEENGHVARAKLDRRGGGCRADRRKGRDVGRGRKRGTRGVGRYMRGRLRKWGSGVRGEEGMEERVGWQNGRL